MWSITRMVTVLASAPATPTSDGGSVQWAENSGRAATRRAASSRMARTRSRSDALAPGSGTSTTARAQPRERLPTMRMSPFGTM